jgi:hypothetical protein
MALRDLDIPTDSRLLHALVSHLRHSQHLLSITARENRVEIGTFTGIAALGALAKRIEHLNVAEPCVWPEELFATWLKLNRLKTIDLHCYYLLRDPDYRLDLRHLSNLRQVTIRRPAGSNTPVTGSTVKHSFPFLPSSCNLLRLERHLAKFWSEEDSAEVERAAEEMQVELKWI